MDDRVIDPSEIIVEQAQKPKANVIHVNPWIRLLARWFDYSLFFLLLLASRKIFHGHLPFSTYENLVPFEYFIWIPIEAFLLKIWGKTPGKWFLKTKLKIGKREKFDYMSGLRRSFSVWFRGIGLGIPVLNCFCMLIAYNKLTVLKMTSWDRDDQIKITHDPIGRWRLYFAVFVAVVGILYYYSEKKRELSHVSGRVIRSVDEYLASETATARFYFPT